MRIRSMLSAVACLAMTGTASCICGDPQPDVVGVNTPQLDVYVGETAKITASAESLNEFCGGTLDDSNKDPGAYAFTSADASIAKVSSTGQITGVAPGSTNITVARGSTKGIVQVTVSKAIAEITITATPASPAVGDTVLATTQAIDFGGQIVSGVHFAGLYLDAFPVQGGTNPSVSGGGAFSGAMRFVIKSPGRYVLRNTYVHGIAGLSARLELNVP